MALFAELQRRNVLRVAAAYVAVSWLLIQVVETLFPVFGLSDRSIRTVVIILAIGFVPAVIVAWAFELTPEGFVRDSEVDRASPSVKARAQRLDRIVMVALALAVGYFAFDKFMLDPARDEARELAVAEAAREEGRAEAIQRRRDAGPPVIAVLPFTAVTDTEDSTFFAAGVHDDLLTKLAQQPSMLVVSRTSVREYKDVQRNVREIGEALGADVLLEGGVQSAGNRIRINAQLIAAKTDEHLWAETYDRELTTASIFDVQDDIARAIAEAMQVTLSKVAGSSIPTDNMAAYRAYHEALTLREADPGRAVLSDEYRNLLQKAVERDPGFTRPLALLVGSYAYAAFGGEEPVDAIVNAEAVLEDLRARAPQSVDHLIAQTYYTYYALKDYDLARELARRTLGFAPSDLEVIKIKWYIERRQGDYDAVIETLRLAQKVEPRNEAWDLSIIFALWVSHRYDEAMAEIEAYDGHRMFLAFLHAMLSLREHGDWQRMVDEVVAIHDDFATEDSLRLRALGYQMGRDFEAAADVLETLPDREVTEIGLSFRQMEQLQVWYFLGEQDKIEEYVAIARDHLDDLDVDYSTVNDRTAFGLALLAAVEGDTAEAERFIQQFLEGQGADRAERMEFRHDLCQILGLAGATEAAVRCIRDGLQEPSKIMPFLHPYLPHYDAIRDEPAFVELVAALEQENSQDQ